MIWYFQTIGYSAVVRGDDEDAAAEKFKRELERTPDHEYMECTELRGPDDFPFNDFDVWHDKDVDGRAVSEHLLGQAVSIPNTELRLHITPDYLEALKRILAYRDLFGHIIEDGHMVLGPLVWVTDDDGGAKKVRHVLDEHGMLAYRQKVKVEPVFTIEISQLLELYHGT